MENPDVETPQVITPSPAPVVPPSPKNVWKLVSLGLFLLVLVLGVAVAYLMKNSRMYQPVTQNVQPTPTVVPTSTPVLASDAPGTREAEVGPGTAEQWPQYTVSLADTRIAFHSPYGKPITELTSLSQYTKGGVFVTGAQQNKLFSLETLKSCDETLIKSGEVCYLEGKRWNQDNDKQDVLLDGNHFVSVYLFDPASSAVIHLLQASQGFPIQISTAVDGAGVEDNFKLLLLTFKFTE